MAGTVVFGPFVGEFGWELLYWQGWVRKLSRTRYQNYRKIVVSRIGYHVFYDTCDEFLGIPQTLFPPDFSARGYISDAWQKGFPGMGTKRRFGFYLVNDLINFRKPTLKYDEAPKGDSSFFQSASKYLDSLVKAYGPDCEFVVPWLLNNINGEIVGFSSTSKPQNLNDYRLSHKPDWSMQDLPKIAAAKRLDVLNHQQHYVCVFPRKRMFRREDKNWSEENYLELIRALQNRNKTVVLCGSPEGAYFADRTPPNCIDLINVDPIERLEKQVAFLNVSQFAIGAMSGAMLFALAAGCPSIIFGELNQLHRYYEENFTKTRLNYVPELSPTVTNLLRIVDCFCENADTLALKQSKN